MGYGAPKEIILIRHADKLLQVKPGPFLSPKGEMRAIAFASYYLHTFPEPDFIIAANPSESKNRASLRELQTVAPLANELAERHPQSDYAVLRNYHNNEEQQLAHDLLYDSQFDGKTILICWHHNKIPQLLNYLGIGSLSTQIDTNDFDTVFDIAFNPNGNVIQFNMLKKQYNISFNGTWSQFYNKMMS